MAVKFPASNSRIDCGSWRNNTPGLPDPTLYDYTVECWVYLYSHKGTIISQWVPGNDSGGSDLGRFQIVCALNKITFKSFLSSGPEHDITTLADVALNTWHHLAHTFVTAVPDPPISYFYLNGVLQGAATNNFYANPGDGSSHIIIGNNDVSVSDDNFDGIVDEVRLWSVARTQAQIQTNMDKRIAPGIPGLERYWRLDEGVAGSLPGGKSALDLASGSNGTFSGTMNPAYADGAPIQWGL